MDAKIQEPVYIGISVGFNPIEKTYQTVDMLDKSIDNLISKLDTMGIEVIKLDLRENHIFIIDSTNRKIITPLKQNIQESIKRK